MRAGADSVCVGIRITFLFVVKKSEECRGKIVDGKEKSCFIQVGIDRSLLNDPVKPHSILDSSTKKGSCLIAAPNLNRAPRKILASDGQMRVARAKN
jgi:hypothetical protein